MASPKRCWQWNGPWRWTRRSTRKPSPRRFACKPPISSAPIRPSRRAKNPCSREIDADATPQARTAQGPRPGASHPSPLFSRRCLDDHADGALLGLRSGGHSLHAAVRRSGKRRDRGFLSGPAASQLSRPHPERTCRPGLQKRRLRFLPARLDGRPAAIRRSGGAYRSHLGDLFHPLRARDRRDHALPPGDGDDLAQHPQCHHHPASVEGCPDILQGQLPMTAANGQRILLPEGWPQPKGYVNGLVARGTLIFLGGQIGWDEKGHLAEGFVSQVGQALDNIVRLLQEAGARPEHVVRLVWFVTDMDGYAGNLKQIGE